VIAERLRQANLTHAVIDLDALALVYPHQGNRSPARISEPCGPPTPPCPM
jgi:hypothetical protein